MRTLFVSLLTLLSLTVFAQQPGDEAERFVEVTGDGEVKVDPNIIYLSISLREHKESGKIVKIEELEGRIVGILETVGIPSEDLKVYGTSGQQNASKAKSNLIVGKRYTLKLTDIELLNPVLEKLGEAKILSVRISEVTHTDIDKFKLEAKSRAVNDAKSKAVLMTSALDSKLGAVLQIRETGLNDSYPQVNRPAREYYLYNNDDDMVHGTTSFGIDSKYQTNGVDFEQIKLTYKIVVKFGIL